MKTPESVLKYKDKEPAPLRARVHRWEIQKRGVHMFATKKLALFLGGVVFGSAGFKVLSSKDAKKVYTQTTAAVLRMKDCTMQTVNKVQEEAGDILADAKAINESRAAEAAQEVIEDTAEEEQPAEQTAQ